MIRRSVYEARKASGETVVAEPVKAKPTPVTEIKVGDKEDYDKAPFIIGQQVVAIKEFKFDKKDYIDEDGKVLNKEQIEKVEKAQNDVNELTRERKLIGTVFREEGDFICVDLKREYSFTNSVYPLDAVFPDRKTFFYFKSDQLGGIKSGVDKKLSKVISFFAKNCKANVNDLCEVIIEKKRNKTEVERRIQDWIKDINNSRLIAIEEENIIKLKVEEIKRLSEGQTEDYDDYYAGILKNPDIKEVDVVGEGDRVALIVTTNELEYSDEKVHRTDKQPLAETIKKLKFNIGGYKFLLYPNGQIKASNYTKFLGTGHHHPCVNSGNDVCTGSQFGAAIKTAIQSGDYAGAAHMMVDFLKRPETNNPFHDPANFLLMQDRKIKEKKELDWFNSSFCQSDVWDKSLYKKKLDEVNEELFGKKKPTKVAKKVDSMEIPF